MSDEQKKPKDIKDLKARLGRTATSIAPPGGSNPPGAGVVPPPVMAPPTLGAKGPGGPMLPGASVAPPPFAQAAANEAAQQKKQLDPFAAAPGAMAVAGQGPREVRIVLDDKAVDEAEIGRKSTTRNLIIVGIGLLLGLALGYLLGIGMNDRRIQNAALHDARDLVTSVRAAQTTLDSADRLVRQAFERATPQTAGTAPGVDFDAITALNALRKPFSPEAFFNKKYSAFGSEAVDNLFHLNNNVQMIWQRIQILAATTLSPAARTELTNAVQATGDLSTTQYGLIPRQIEGAFAGSLVYVDRPAPVAEGATPPTTATVRTGRGAAGVPKTIYNGQPLDDGPDNFVVLIDTQSSMHVLGQGLTSFAEYRRRLVELKALLDDTKEVRGRLEATLTQLGSSSDVFSL
ncbi:MAG: hypothetical protein IPK60_25410 [Sandaracinaceae bacterium]|jgi:hypothetical protein|nr:hypothetical protein [Sandaracinaceae bacterium]